MIGVSITTYEFSKGKYNPILTHIFWGETIEKAIGIAKSHTITDIFFASSFIGEMNWKDTVLYLNNSGEIINSSNKENIDEIMKEIADRANKSGKFHEDLGMLNIVEYISKQF